jgi:hydrogenase maturation protein HypF
MRVDVRGIVQGVGFRPFVYGLARRLALAGLVGNDTSGVFIEIEGGEQPVNDFLVALRPQAPPLARIEWVGIRELALLGSTDFTIMDSDATGPRDPVVAADRATCADCLAELTDPGDRRFGYPFINCTNCGPRFTIVCAVPYDRRATTMAGFAMCTACAAEYHDPADRRFHAQPVCCPVCGPRLSLLTPNRQAIPGDAVGQAAELLRTGGILAVKGLGGYHLAADATDTAAVATLRARKHRDEKPFAVMVATLDDAHRICRLDPAAQALLTGSRRPIVLAERRAAAPIVESVAPGNRYLGVMLPYTPLHHLLLGAVPGPVVLTSGNRSDEPIAHRDEDAVHRLDGIADAYLTHDRAIHVRTDDSVARAFRGRPVLVRRSRGYAPEPLTVPWRFQRPVLACGAELKNTFCLGRGNRAILSHHIGDLENYPTLRSFTEGIEHFVRLFGIPAAIVAHDLHPEYLSTKYALDLPDVELVGVQHHHAHIASCLADNGQAGPVIGVAFDGTGYGSDATIWGGEFLIADITRFERVGHLAPVRMPGAAAAIREPWRMAASYLHAAYPDGPPEDLDVRRRRAGRWEAVVAMLHAEVNSPLTTSAGRLFDAVAALLGVRDEIRYEGQAAIELEQWADTAERAAYPSTVDCDVEGQLVVSGVDLVRAVLADLRRGTDPAVIAARFHHGLAHAVVRTCHLVRDRTGVDTVALSGGVFQNMLLLEGCVAGLETAGFRVLTHSRVPANDGGISLGQAVIAGMA